jgi:NADH:ubiquinone oxidoreductase subunit 6 (subunit J)
MTFQTAVFYAFAAILVFAALRVITSRNPVHSALWLVLSFFSAAGVWILLRAEFLAIVLVLVYVGAVMVLFLFVVMMLDVNFDKLRERFRSYIPVGGTVGILVLVEMALVLIGGQLQQYARTGAANLYGLRLSVGDRGGPAAGRDHCRDRLDASRATREQISESVRAGKGAARRQAARIEDAGREARTLIAGAPHIRGNNKLRRLP